MLDFPPSAETVAAAFGVHLVTARRWISGRTTPPPYVVAAARLMLGRELGALDSAWSGWRLERGALCGPWGIRATPLDVEFLPHLWREATRPEAPQLALFPDDSRAWLRRAGAVTPSSR